MSVCVCGYECVCVVMCVCVSVVLCVCGGLLCCTPHHVGFMLSGAALVFAVSHCSHPVEFAKPGLLFLPLACLLSARPNNGCQIPMNLHHTEGTGRITS